MTNQADPTRNLPHLLLTPDEQQEYYCAHVYAQKRLDELAALRAFKAYVHQRLDEAGVTVDPDSPHKAEGCRIGGRLDEVFSERDALRARVAGLEHERDQLRGIAFWLAARSDINLPSWIRGIIRHSAAMSDEEREARLRAERALAALAAQPPTGGT
jgi:hypothetical protein